ncbi:hypothetical protein D3C85_691590 [compost metagenome]
MNTERFIAYYTDGVLTIQEADYVEDGWLIKTGANGKFEVWLIPQYGGEEAHIETFESFHEALKFTKEH